MSKRRLDSNRKPFGIFSVEEAIPFDRFVLGHIALHCRAKTLLRWARTSKRLLAEVTWLLQESTLVDIRPDFFFLNLVHALQRASDANGVQPEKDGIEEEGKALVVWNIAAFLFVFVFCFIGAMSFFSSLRFCLCSFAGTPCADHAVLPRARPIARRQQGRLHDTHRSHARQEGTGQSVQENVRFVSSSFLLLFFPFLFPRLMI
jgi:hypothetical protein